MFPFWMESVWPSLPCMLASLGAAAAILLHVTVGYR
jgi:hypothetical protein